MSATVRRFGRPRSPRRFPGGAWGRPTTFGRQTDTRSIVAARDPVGDQAGVAGTSSKRGVWK